MKDIIDMAKHRGYFIDQSQSLNLFVEGATMAKLTSMHFYGWKSGLKTGMYYLRTKSAVDAIKFTLDKKVEEDPALKEPIVKEEKPEIVANKKHTAKKAAEKFAKTKEIDVDPMTPKEMKELIAKTNESQEDDCLMCGS